MTHGPFAAVIEAAGIPAPIGASVCTAAPLAFRLRLARSAARPGNRGRNVDGRPARSRTDTSGIARSTTPPLAGLDRTARDIGHAARRPSLALLEKAIVSRARCSGDGDASCFRMRPAWAGPARYRVRQADCFVAGKAQLGSVGVCLNCRRCGS